MRVYFGNGFLYFICGGAFLYFVHVSFARVGVDFIWDSVFLYLVFWIVYLVFEY